MRKSLSRRSFIGKSSSALAAFTIVPRHVVGRGETHPSDKLNIAGVGVGGRGLGDLQAVSRENIVALCDVDERYASGAFRQWPDAKRYTDFRKMLETQKDIDAVVIATPDHTHAVIAMMAIRLGKHVYCEKPLTHSVYEARKLAEAAKEAKVATQMGNQGQASEEARVVAEMILDGAIGTVREVHAWSNRVPDISERGIPRPKETPPVPEWIDWDLWIGPSPMRPYHPCYHPFSWRGWWDFGTGVLGDIGCHEFSTIFKTLKLGHPKTVEACSTNWQKPKEIRDETAPLASIVRYRFEATEHHGPLTISWYDGGMKPPRPEELDPGVPFGVGDGILFPASRRREYSKPSPRLPRSPGHHEEWLIAAKGGPPAGSNFVDHAAHLAEVVLLGNIAIRANEKLEWDPVGMRFPNCPAADAYVNPPYRSGWSL